MAQTAPVPVPASRPAPAMSDARPLLVAGLAGAQDALFAVKTFVAAILAYGIALEIGLSRPYWAVTTCFIVAQPLAGAVLSKAVFRLIGTFVGAVVAVVLVPLLVDAPELLSLALALWLGLCTYVSMLDRSPRAYVFLLSGYTAAIIGFPAVVMPGQVFEIAAVRAQEIGIGILASALVHALVFPRSATTQAMRRIERMIADAVEVSCAVLTLASDDRGEAGRRRLIGDFGEIGALAVHLPYDMSRRPIRQDLLYALQHELMQILALAGAVRDRLRRLGDGVPPDIARLIADAGDGLRRGEEDAALIGRARALEPIPGLGFDVDAALRLSLLDRLAALVVAHRNCRAIQNAIGRPTRRLSPPLAALARNARRPKRHLDHGVALRAAVATTATVVAGCAFWIATAWADGASAVVLASIICALYANLDAPTKATRHVLYGVAIAVPVAAVYVFVLMPRITEFPVLAMTLAPAFLIVSVLSQQPGLGALSIGLILALPGLIGLGDRYNGDFTQFANNAVAQILGACLAAITLALLRGIGAAAARARLMTAARRALARRFGGERTGTTQDWIAAMFDRIALLSVMGGAASDEGTEQIAEMLRLLRLGMAIDAIGAAARHVGRRNAALLGQLLRRGKQALMAAERGASSEALFELAMTRLAGSEDVEVRRAAILAMTSLRYNIA